jgi:hypothetical protein
MRWHSEDYVDNCPTSTFLCLDKHGWYCCWRWRHHHVQSVLKSDWFANQRKWNWVPKKVKSSLKVKVTTVYSQKCYYLSVSTLFVRTQRRRKLLREAKQFPTEQREFWSFRFCIHTHTPTHTPLHKTLLSTYYMSRWYCNKSKSQLTSPTPAQAASCCIISGTYSICGGVKEFRFCILGAKFQSLGPKSVRFIWPKYEEIFGQKFTAHQNYFFSLENLFFLPASQDAGNRIAYVPVICVMFCWIM